MTDDTEKAINDIAVCANLIERSTRRLHSIANLDGPPSLVRGEAEFILRRLTELRANLAKLDHLPA